MRTVCLIIWFSLCVSAAFAAPIHWAVDAGGNGHWYEAVLASSGITRSDSNTAAIASGGYLATITSAAENAFVTSLISGNPDYWYYTESGPPDPPGGIWTGPWFGGYQDPSAPDYGEPSGAWSWVTGESWGYTNWAPSEPNDAWGNAQQDLLHFAVKGSSDLSLGTWDDAHETSSYKGYLVEWNTNPVPEPSCLLALLTGGASLFGFALRRRK